MTERICGSCLCGAVAFETLNDFEHLYLCSCSQCQKITGSAFASNLMQSSAGFSWSKGEEYVYRFKLPERDITKAFCKICGSGLPYVSGDRLRVTIPAGSLVGAPKVATRYRIFDSERPDWCADYESMNSVPAFPNQS